MSGIVSICVGVLSQLIILCHVISGYARACQFPLDPTVVCSDVLETIAGSTYNASEFCRACYGKSGYVGACCVTASVIGRVVSGQVG